MSIFTSLTVFSLFYGLKSNIHRPTYNIYSLRPFLDETNLCFRKKNSLMTPVFTHFLLSHASANTASRNIGGRIHGPSPHLKLWGPSPRRPPMSPPTVVHMKYKFHR